MQDYYNIPIYRAGGGILSTLGGSSLEYLTKHFLKDTKNLKALKGLANLNAKKNPILSEGINNLVAGKLDEKGIGALQKLAKEHLVKTHAYQTRLKNVQNILKYRSQAQNLLKRAEVAEKKLAGIPPKPFLIETPKVKITPITDKVAETPVQAVVQATETPAAQSAVESAVQAAAESPTTISSLWSRGKNWVNNHPKIVLGGAALGLGTGPGRYILGNTLAATQSNPATWFGGTTADGSNDFIVINGTKIPIKRSPEGYFVPIDASDNSQQAASGDAVDQTLAGITNDNIGVPSTDQTTQQQYTGEVPNISQQDINDLFDEDQ